MPPSYELAKDLMTETYRIEIVAPVYTRDIPAIKEIMLANQWELQKEI